MVLAILVVNEHQPPNVSMPASVWVDSQVTYGGRTIFFHFVPAFHIMSEYYSSLKKALIETESFN